MMGDVERNKAGQGARNVGSSKLGCSLKYLFSFPGLLRILAIALGAVNLGLWIPGYGNQFYGERQSSVTGDTSRGYGNGWRQEPLNEFVMTCLAAAWGISILFLLALCVLRTAVVDWSRTNKFLHLGLCIVQLIAMICAIFGILYFNQNCCHISMHPIGLGFLFYPASGEGTYQRHCYCYYSLYQSVNTGNENRVQVTTERYFPGQGVPIGGGTDHVTTYAAHHMSPHIAAVPLIFLNAVVYYLAFLFPKSKN